MTTATTGSINELLTSVPMPSGWPQDVRPHEMMRSLTRRELEILGLVAASMSDREIADALCISYRTVTTHVAHIFDKLGIRSRRTAMALVWHVTGPVGQGLIARA